MPRSVSIQHLSLRHAHMTPSIQAIPTVAKLFVHPLKGAAPVAVTAMPLDALGALGDRRWLLADQHGVMITPRAATALAGIHAALPMRDGAILADGPLTLRADGLDVLSVSHADAHAPLRTVQCWDDTIEMADAGELAAQWCSEAIGTACRLLHLAPESHRPLAPKYTGPIDAGTRTVSVTDGAPLLLLSQSSIDALNERLLQAGETPVGVERFRPNVLIAGTTAHDEDTWSLIEVGGVEIGVGSPCPRCVFTTINPRTLERGVEPLRTLATYRRGDGGGVMFGMNATHRDAGVIRVRETIHVRARR